MIITLLSILDIIINNELNIDESQQFHQIKGLVSNTHYTVVGYFQHALAHSNFLRGKVFTNCQGYLVIDVCNKHLESKIFTNGYWFMNL